MRVAFDVNGTLLDENKKVNPEILFLIRWFIQNGDRVIVWSNAGGSYARRETLKLGIQAVECASKGDFEVDLSFDDQEVDLAKVNIKIGGSHV